MGGSLQQYSDSKVDDNVGPPMLQTPKASLSVRGHLSPHNYRGAAMRYSAGTVPHSYFSATRYPGAVPYASMKATAGFDWYAGVGHIWGRDSVQCRLERCYTPKCRHWAVRPMKPTYPLHSPSVWW
ncbi:hypothetical protein O3G_MSEX000064 [Manduca sexta]|nr:hypothetical protein O3G_MSEX000064 [Manduca sexta]